jgi:isoquinoline 1-oxidoreductase alpha subunit
MSTTLTVNGRVHELADLDPATPLLWVLRDHLGLVGTKYGCGQGLCGACTVHFNGAAMRSCVLPLAAAAGQKITTIEGLAADARLTPLQQAWCDEDVSQCGYCQAGQIMSATALLAINPRPTDADIDGALAGNLCRCGTYQRIRRAVHAAAETLPA